MLPGIMSLEIFGFHVFRVAFDLRKYALAALVHWCLIAFSKHHADFGPMKSIRQSLNSDRLGSWLTLEFQEVEKI